MTIRPCRLAVLLFLCGLGGCQTLTTVIAPSWSLYAPEVFNRGQYDKDRAYCQTVAEGYYTPFDAFGTGLAVVNGAAGQPQSLQSAGIGAGAGLVSKLATTVGLSHDDERALYVDCAREKTRTDHSAYLPLQR